MFNFVQPNIAVKRVSLLLSVRKDMKGSQREQRRSSTHSDLSSIRRGMVNITRSGHITPPPPPEKKHRHPLKTMLGGPRTGLDVVEKREISWHMPGPEPRIAQLVVYSLHQLRYNLYSETFRFQNLARFNTTSCPATNSFHVPTGHQSLFGVGTD